MTLVREYVVDCCSKMFLTVLSEMPLIIEGCFFIKTRVTVQAVFENGGEDGSSYLLIIKSLILSDFLFFFCFYFTIPFHVLYYCSGVSFLLRRLMGGSSDTSAVSTEEDGFFFDAFFASGTFNSFLERNFFGDNNFVNRILCFFC